MEHTKKLAVLLALSVAAFGSTARATEYTETISGSGDTSYSGIKTDDGNGNYTYAFGEGDSLNVTDTASAYGIAANNKAVNKITVTSPLDIHVEMENKSNAADVAGLWIGPYVGSAEIDRSGGGNITVISRGSTERNYASVFGAKIVYNATDSTIRLGDANVDVQVTDAQYGAYAAGLSAEGKNGSHIYMGDGTVKVQADAVTGEVDSYGIRAFYGGVVDLGNVQISVSAGGTPNIFHAFTYGIYTEDSSLINLAGGEISVYTEATGTDTQVQQYSVYNAGGTVNLNQGTANQLVVNGDVGSVNENSKTNLNFNTAQSALNGSIFRYAGTVNMNLANGAVWNNGTGFYGDRIASNVSSLSMAGGVVHQQSAADMTIQNYSGTGDFLFQADGTTPDGVLSFDASQTGHVVIEKADAGSAARLSVSNQTIDTLDPAKAEDSLKVLAHQMVYRGGDDALTGMVELKEGLITPYAAGDLNFYEAGEGEEGHGYVTNVTRGPQETATMDAMKHVAAVSVLAWRQEDSTFSQRLGDLRRSAGGQGLWARMSRGEFKYDGEYKNQYDFYQLGYDRASGAWHYGAAVSYNDGETSYRAGYGENSSAALSLYGTWLGNKGHYADIVLKGGKLSNEYTITTAAGRTHGDYDLWGVSLSGEYGREIALADGWFVTPQAQMTLLHIGSEDYTTSNGIRVSQESLDSAVGRVGLEAGKRFGAGRVYGKFSLLHDFAGSADTRLRYEGIENSYREDIGDTWCEAGFGVNLRLTDSTYFYADAVRTFGGDIETPWQWNAGVRWGF